MNLYRCFILEDSGGPVGFYTTRFVRADSPAQVELLALELLRSDPRLDIDPSKRTGDARIFFESIEEIDAIPEDVNAAGTGYAFFRMGT